MKSILTASAIALALALTTPALAQNSNAPGAAKEHTTQKAKPAAKKDDKAAPDRANKGGAQRGDDRAGQVRQQNEQRKAN